MKKILFLSAVLLSLIFSSCSKNEGESDPNSLKKHIIIKETLYKYGKPSTYDIMEKQFFNEDGLLTRKETNYYSSIIEKRIPEYFIYKYDNQNRLIEIQERDQRTEFSYNNIDSISEKRIYGEHGLSDHIYYRYNEKKQLIEVDEIGLILKSEYYHKLTYTGNNVTHRDTYDEDKKLWWTFDYNYDTHGNLIKTTNVDPKDGSAEIEKLCEYTYNADGTIKSYRFKWGYSTEMNHVEAYTYNPDKTIKEVHLQYGQYDERHRIYEYVIE